MIYQILPPPRLRTRLRIKVDWEEEETRSKEEAGRLKWIGEVIVKVGK